MRLFRIFLIVPILFFAKTALSQCTPVPQVESVLNGNFEQGYIASGPGSFITSHNYTSIPLNSPNTYFTVGRGDLDYVVSGNSVTSSSYVHPWFNTLNGDHTPGMGRAGNALWIDGDGGVAGLGAMAWQQTVTVIPNQIYTFSGWFINATSPSTGTQRAQIRFVVEAFNSGGTSMGVDQLSVKDYIDESATDGSGNYIWEQKNATWTAPIGAVTAKISIYNQNGVVDGNDFGIDDISFINSCSALETAVTPPAPNLGPNINYCNNASSTITLNSNVATNAGAGRVYSWYTGTGNPQTEVVHESTSQNTYNITTPGTYRVCVYQPSGCAKSSTVVVTETASASGSGVNYCVSDQLTTTIAPTTIEPYLTYAWTKNGSTYAGTSKTNTVNGAGTYIVTGTHSNGRAACNISNSFTVTASTATITNAISPASASICASMSQALASSLSGAGYTYRWQRDAPGGAVTFVDLPGGNNSSYSANTAGDYRLIVDFNKSGCAAITSTVANITTTNPIVAQDAALCPSPTASAILRVTPVLSGVYKWYQSDGVTGIAGTPSATSSDYTTPALSVTTTYWVEDISVGANTTLTTTAGSNNGWGINPEVSFSLTNPIILKSVRVVRGGQHQGPLVAQIEVVNSSGVRVGVASSAVSVSDGTVVSPSTFTFNGATGITIPIGTGYKIRFITPNTPALNFGAIQSASNPSGSGVAITGVSSGNNIFGNWVIAVPSNPCSKVPVVAYVDCALPVDFVNFTASTISNGNYLQWIVANEVDVRHYEIEKSSDGVNFVTIGSVQADANGTGRSYTYLDQTSGSSTDYYRIKEVDLNGAVSYSTIVALNSRANDNILVVTQNPFEESTLVYFVTSPEEVNYLRVTDSKGAIIADYTVRGGEVLSIGEHLVSGMYLLHAYNSNELKTYKVIKK